MYPKLYYLCTTKTVLLISCFCLFFFSIQDGRTVMHYAAAFAKDDIVKTLLNKKADITISGGVSHV